MRALAELVQNNGTGRVEQLPIARQSWRVLPAYPAVPAGSCFVVALK